MASRETEYGSDGDRSESPDPDGTAKTRDEGRTIPKEHTGVGYGSDIDADGDLDPDYVAETETEQHGRAVGTNKGEEVDLSSDFDVQAIMDVDFEANNQRVELSGSDAGADGEPGPGFMVDTTSEEQGAAAKSVLSEGHAHGSGVQFNTKIFEQTPTTHSTTAGLEQPVQSMKLSKSVDESRDGDMFSRSEGLSPESVDSDVAFDNTMANERAAEATRQAILNRLNKRFDATAARVERRLKEARDILQQGAVFEHEKSRRLQHASKERYLKGNEGIEVDNVSDYDEESENLYNDQLYSKRQKRNSSDPEVHMASTQRAPESKDLVSRQKPSKEQQHILSKDYQQSQSTPLKSAPNNLGPRTPPLRKWRYPRARHYAFSARMNMSRIYSDYILSVEFVDDINQMLDFIRHFPRDHAVVIMQSFRYDPHNEGRRITFIEDRVLTQHWSVHIHNPNLSKYHPRIWYARHNSSVSGLPECVKWIENGMKGNFSMCRGGCDFGCPRPITKEEKERRLARGRALRKKEEDEKAMPPPPKRFISPVSEVQSPPPPSPRPRPLSDQQIAEMVKAPLFPPRAPRPGPAKLLLTPEQWAAVDPVKPPGMQSPSLLSGRLGDSRKPRTASPTTKVVPTCTPRGKAGYTKVIKMAPKKKNYYVKPLPLSATQVFDFGQEKLAPQESATHGEDCHFVDPSTPSVTQVNRLEPAIQAPYPPALTKSFLDQYRENLIQTVSKISGQKRSKKQHPKRELWQTDPERH
ncbi:hypothetical protein HBH98_006370 [Parastagonospora nodorum]|nr:hypothetical protein HBI09_021300 [Parastagonospora nodorum]KAH4199074.1 hypothetical protein HBH42_052730 [Parastagonospora nodorum]KAH4271674.1 hypothetical protein HBI03_031600 [Parastagonospora nodorum]KAH4282056.1 hypothetical protein HBI04_026450 [Parastagonospora nodorum]KAH4290930.1 hypothetical protein HBI01_196230 [Parastagonospora nodorum]